MADRMGFFISFANFISRQKYGFFNMNFVYRGCFIIIVFICFSCGSNRWEVDTDKVVYDGTIARLDMDIFAVDPANAHTEVQALTAKYGDFLDMYFYDIMQSGRSDNPMSAQLLMRFTTDPMWEGLQKEIEIRFSDMGAYELQFSDAFKKYAVLFETDTLPRIVGYNSGFNVGIYPTKAYLGVGLEWYAGSDLKVVQQLPPDLFPQYKRDKMRPELLVVNALKGWLMVTHQNTLNDMSLLGRMVYAGKVIYLTKALMPEVSDADLLNFSEAQLGWCEQEEWGVWKHFLESDLLFTQDIKEINRMVGDGPFTPGMPAESPGGVGNWVGYRMVDSFMKANPNLTLRAMMAQKDDQVYLKTYKPGR